MRPRAAISAADGARITTRSLWAPRARRSSRSAPLEAWGFVGPLPDDVRETMDRVIGTLVKVAR